jgi:hypothetical protein
LDDTLSIIEARIAALLALLPSTGLMQALSKMSWRVSAP